MQLTISPTGMNISNAVWKWECTCKVFGYFTLPPSSHIWAASITNCVTLESVQHVPQRALVHQPPERFTSGLSIVCVYVLRFTFAQ